MYGFYNEYTGDEKDGNFYCKACGEQVSVGFRHHHARKLLGQLRKLENRYRNAVITLAQRNGVSVEQVERGLDELIADIKKDQT